MKQLKLRFATADESGKIVEMLNASEDNKFDPDILGYPSLRVLCSYSSDGVVSYLPFQRVFMLESAAHSAGASVGDKAQSFRDFTKAVELLASGEGIREIYFLDGAGGIGEMSKNHGYEELPYKVYRMKV